MHCNAETFLNTAGGLQKRITMEAGLLAADLEPLRKYLRSAVVLVRCFLPEYLEDHFKQTEHVIDPYVGQGGTTFLTVLHGKYSIAVLSYTFCGGDIKGVLHRLLSPSLLICLKHASKNARCRGLRRYE